MFPHTNNTHKAMTSTTPHKQHITNSWRQLGHHTDATHYCSSTSTNIHVGCQVWCYIKGFSSNTSVWQCVLFCLKWVLTLRLSLLLLLFFASRFTVNTELISHKMLRPADKKMYVIARFPLFLFLVRTLYWFSQLPKYYNGNDLVLILFVVVVVVVVIVVLQAHSDHFDLVSRRMGFIPLPLASVVSTFIITPTSLSFAVNINWCLDLCTDASSGNTVYQIPWHTGDMLNGHGLFLVSRYFGWMEE